MPISEIALGLLQLKGVQLALRRAVSNLTPLVLNSWTIGALNVRLTSVGIHHVDLGKVILELLNGLHSVLFYHVIHLVVAIAW